MNIDPSLNKLTNEQLQDLLWKMKQAKQERIDAPHTRASIYWDPNLPGYRIAVPYRKEFVTALKANILAKECGYDETTKTWTILGETHFLAASQLLLIHFLGNIGQMQSKREYEAELAARQANNAPMTKEQKAAVVFVAYLDLESLASAFKKRAITLHPDKGGDSKDFSEFNAAYQMLKETMK